MPFGKRLKDARLSQGMTQEDLASAIGVTKGAIGNYESEVSSPKEPILIKLMDVLHVDANYLYQDFIEIKDNFTSEERHLVKLYRGAEQSAKEIALETLANHQKKGSEETAI